MDRRLGASTAVVIACTACGRFDFAPSDRAADDGAAGTADAPAGADASEAFVFDGGLHPWTYVTTSVASGSDPNTATAMVVPGDLVFAACDYWFQSTAATFTADPPELISLSPVHNYFGQQLATAIAWGVVTDAAGSGAMLDVTSNITGGSSDCSVNVFAGGGPAPKMFDAVDTMSGSDDPVTCGPVTTAADGVAFYMASRWDCADAPTAGPFGQLGTRSGNPWGAATPTGGTAVSAQLASCGGSGGWICSVVSVSP